METLLTPVPSQNGHTDQLGLIDIARSKTVPRREPLARFESDTNLVETWDSYIVQVALPGVDPASLKLEMVARRLTVSGKFCVPVIEGGNDIWRGIPCGEFSQAFDLPAEVDADQSEARCGQGILTITLPKVAYLKPKVVHLVTGR
jgi:HSP20 family protein